MPAVSPTPTTVQALSRGLRLLRLFTRDRPALTLGDCAGLLDLPAPSTYRLLNTLEAERFVERDGGSGAYRLAPGALELMPPLLDGLDVPRLARPVIASLAAATGETASLAVLEGPRVLYLVSESSDRLLRSATVPGLQHDAYCSALGKSLLAQLPDGRARALLGTEPYRALTERTLTSWDAMRRELGAIRRRGYALSEGEFEEGLSSCAVALPSSAGPPQAINLSSPSARMPRKLVRESFVPLLERAASEIAKLTAPLELDGGRPAR